MQHVRTMRRSSLRPRLGMGPYYPPTAPRPERLTSGPSGIPQRTRAHSDAHARMAWRGARMLKRRLPVSHDARVFSAMLQHVQTNTPAAHDPSRGSDHAFWRLPVLCPGATPMRMARRSGRSTGRSRRLSMKQCEKSCSAGPCEPSQPIYDPSERSGHSHTFAQAKRTVS